MENAPRFSSAPAGPQKLLINHLSLRQDHKMRIPVFAIDVGYGSTKYTYRDRCGAVVAHAFPSLSPLAPIRKLSRWNEKAFTARKTAEITVNRIDYEVGPDISITAAHGWTGSVLADDFALTGNYAALLFGALHFSGVTHVDHLVLGLPVHLMGEFSGALKRRFLGKFEFGIGSVTIDDVIVGPQPMGGLVYAARCRKDYLPVGEPRLVIDVGYYTISWVYAHGFNIDGRRSCGMRAGTWDLCKCIAERISRDEDERIDDIERIDVALRENTPYLFYGKEIDPAPYLDLAMPIVSNAAREIRNHVGQHPDLHSIILTGGGAELFTTAIQNAFPNVLVEIVDQPSFANVHGYRLIGEAKSERVLRANR